jgi:predicted PurR-regulated permease PerM
VGIAGFLIAYVFNPLVDLLGRARINRGVAVALVFLLLTQALVVGSVLLSQVVAETARFVNLLPAALANLGDTFGAVTGWLGRLGESLPEVLQERFGIDAGGEEFALQVQAQVTAWLTGGGPGLGRFVERIVVDGPQVLLAGATTIVSGAFQVVLIAIASAYILYDYPRLGRNIRRFVPVRYRGALRRPGPQGRPRDRRLPARPGPDHDHPRLHDLDRPHPDRGAAGDGHQRAGGGVQPGALPGTRSSARSRPCCSASRCRR